jgi:hypothetical protein
MLSLTCQNLTVQLTRSLFSYIREQVREGNRDRAEAFAIRLSDPFRTETEIPLHPTQSQAPFRPWQLQIQGMSFLDLSGSEDLVFSLDL